MNGVFRLIMKSYITVLAGAALFVIGLIMPSKQAALKKNGKKAEGIIFDFNGDPDPLDDTAIPINDPECARVRFVTEQLEWITESVRNAVGFQLNGNFKAGEKVTVYYDPANPRLFFVDTGIPEAVVHLLMMIAGLMVAGAGAYAIFTHSSQLTN